MSSSRVTFSRFSGPNDPMLEAWRRFRGRFGIIDPGPQPDAAELVVWRLYASNNRELARGARLHGSADEARDAVAELRASRSQLGIQLVRGPEAGMFGWLAELGGVPVVTGARWYPASVCADAAALAVALLPAAEPAEGWQPLGRGVRARVVEPAVWR
ncbi:hypothetical protein [Agromyces seonyuensis]|uniref:hypothetical protein n=1 Tax=Agromyces seonyuensis TaxID=2662446 RepID=UPI001365CCF1|nr:hypothetical protein [Agromyces seonyuensis]